MAMRQMLLLLAIFSLACGCSHNRTVNTRAEDYETVAKDPRRDTEQARAENLRALQFIESGKYDPSLPLAFKLASVFSLQIAEIFSPD